MFLCAKDFFGFLELFGLPLTFLLVVPDYSKSLAAPFFNNFPPRPNRHLNKMNDDLSSFILLDLDTDKTFVVVSEGLYGFMEQYRDLPLGGPSFVA